MTNHELEIIMKLRDEVSKRLEGVQGNLVKFANGVGNTSKTLETMGRQMSKVGSTMMILGGSIMGPLILALKNADKYSGPVHKQMENLNNMSTRFQVQIATALVPILERFVNTLGVLWNAWNKLGPATQQIIVQGVALTGIFLAVGGAVFYLGGKIGFLIEKIGDTFDAFLKWSALNWQFALIAVAIAGIIALMVKFPEVATVALNTVEVGAYMVAIGFEKTAKAIAYAIEMLGAWSNNAQMTQFGADEVQRIDVVIAQLESRMSRVFSTGKGTLATGFEGIKNQIGDLFDLLKNPPKINVDPLEERLKSLQEIAHNVFQAMNRDLSNFLFNSLKEKSLNFQTFFQNLGFSILQIWTDMLAEMITKWAEAKVIMAIGNMGTGGGAGAAADLVDMFDFSSMHSGGNVRYHSGGSIPGFAATYAHSGINLAPAERPIIALTGERVLSREENKDYSQGQRQGNGVTFTQHFNIKANDAKSFMSHKKEIVACVKQDILHSAEIRRVILAHANRR